MLGNGTVLCPFERRCRGQLWEVSPCTDKSSELSLCLSCRSNLECIIKGEVKGRVLVSVFLKCCKSNGFIMHDLGTSPRLSGFCWHWAPSPIACHCKTVHRIWHASETGKMSGAFGPGNPSLQRVPFPILSMEQWFSCNVGGPDVMSYDWWWEQVVGGGWKCKLILCSFLEVAGGGTHCLWSVAPSAFPLPPHPFIPLLPFQPELHSYKLLTNFNPGAVLQCCLMPYLKVKF